MLSRRTKARIQWVLSGLLGVFLFASYVLGRRYATAVDAGDRPSRAELADRMDTDCGDGACSVDAEEQQHDDHPGDGARTDDQPRSDVQEDDPRTDDDRGTDTDGSIRSVFSEAEGRHSTVSFRQLYAASCADQYGDYRLRSRWIVLGACSGTVGSLWRDYDLFDHRSNRHRQLLYVLVRATVERHCVDDEAQFSVAIGTSVGSFLYRTVFGVLRAPPGDE